MEVRVPLLCSTSDCPAKMQVLTVCGSRGCQPALSHIGRWPRRANLFWSPPPKGRVGCPKSRIGSTDMHFAPDLPRMNGFSVSLNHGSDRAHGVDHRRIRGARTQGVPKPEPSAPCNERSGSQRRAMAASPGIFRSISPHIVPEYPIHTNREEEPVLGLVAPEKRQCLASHNQLSFHHLRCSLPIAAHEFW